MGSRHSCVAGVLDTGQPVVVGRVLVIHLLYSLQYRVTVQSTVTVQSSDCAATMDAWPWLDWTAGETAGLDKGAGVGLDWTKPAML